MQQTELLVPTGTTHTVWFLLPSGWSHQLVAAASLPRLHCTCMAPSAGASGRPSRRPHWLSVVLAAVATTEATASAAACCGSVFRDAGPAGDSTPAACALGWWALVTTTVWETDLDSGVAFTDMGWLEYNTENDTHAGTHAGVWENDLDSGVAFTDIGWLEYNTENDKHAGTHAGTDFDVQRDHEDTEGDDVCGEGVDTDGGVGDDDGDNHRGYDEHAGDSDAPFFVRAARGRTDWGLSYLRTTCRRGWTRRRGWTLTFDCTLHLVFLATVVAALGWMAIVGTLCLVAACALPAASAAALLVACEVVFTCATTVMLWPSSGKAVAFFVAHAAFSGTLSLITATCRLVGLCCQLAGHFWVMCCTSECTLVRWFRTLVVAVVVAISTHQHVSGRQRHLREVVCCAACVGVALFSLLPVVVSALWAVALVTQVVRLVVTTWRHGGVLLVGGAAMSLYCAVAMFDAAWVLCAALRAAGSVHLLLLGCKLARHCGMGWMSFSLTVATVVPVLVSLLCPSSLGRGGVVWCIAGGNVAARLSSALRGVIAGYSDSHVDDDGLCASGSVDGKCATSVGATSGDDTAAAANGVCCPDGHACPGHGRTVTVNLDGVPGLRKTLHVAECAASSCVYEYVAARMHAAFQLLVNGRPLRESGTTFCCLGVAGVATVVIVPTVVGGARAPVQQTPANPSRVYTEEQLGKMTAATLKQLVKDLCAQKKQVYSSNANKTVLVGVVRSLQALPDATEAIEATTRQERDAARDKAVEDTVRQATRERTQSEKWNNYQTLVAYCKANFPAAFVAGTGGSSSRDVATHDHINFRVLTPKIMCSYLREMILKKMSPKQAKVYNAAPVDAKPDLTPSVQVMEKHVLAVKWMAGKMNFRMQPAWITAVDTFLDGEKRRQAREIKEG